ncbi:MAG: DUF523 domain-containing protein [Magnetococcales bacterium]|nr:DUF523 domain-containing protein [Magnetococcales bacterium]
MPDTPCHPSASAPLRLGISACLLGERVRYDGGHRHNPLLSGPKTAAIQWFPCCPETGCGLGVPREPMRLEGHADRPRLRTVLGRQDHTEQVQDWCQNHIRQVTGVAGWLLKSRSPSCGLAVTIFAEDGVQQRTGMGILPRMLLAHDPAVPMIEGDLLRDEQAVDAFLRQVEERRQSDT